MSPALGAVIGAFFGCAVLLLILALQPRTDLPREKARGGMTEKWKRLTRRPTGSAGRRRDLQLVLSILGAIGAYAVTGWLMALVLVPLSVFGVPWLFHDPNKAHIAKLAALEAWIRQVRSLLIGGADTTLEAALIASLPSAPAAIHGQVKHLVARLNSRWDTDRALVAFAEDINDSVGDTVAGAMILAFHRRSGGLSDVMEGLAEAVHDEVDAKRKQESAKAGTRTAVRYMTLLVLIGVPLMRLLAPEYLEPYRSPFGQLLLLATSALYIGGLLLLHRLGLVKPTPRIYPRRIPKNGAVL